MTRILWYIAFLLLLSATGRAQFPVRVQVNVVQPVPPYLPQLKADLAGNHYGQLNQDISSHLSIILSYTGRSQQRIKLAGSIERVAPAPISVSLRPDFQPAAPIIMGPQQAMLSLNSSLLQSAFGNFSENSLVFTNCDLNTLRQNGVDYKLPEGTYRICVTAYDYDHPGFSAPLSPPGTGCAYFTICYTASAPQFILPVTTILQSNSGFLDLTPRSTQVQFTWTPPATTCGMPFGPLTYEIEIRRVFNGQTVTDALSNPYVFHQQNIPATTFFLDTLKYAHVLVPGQQYITRVKANFIPMIGSPLEVANQGYSQIGAFTWQPVNYFPGNGLAANNNPDSSQIAANQGKPLPPGATILPGGYIVQNYTPGASCPAGAPVSGTTPLSSGPAGQDLTIGGFKMHVDQATANTDGSYHGTGYVVWHPFAADIHLSVNFDSLRVNDQKVVFAGVALTATAGGFPDWSVFGGSDAIAKLTGLAGNSLGAIQTRIGSGASSINQASAANVLSFPLGLTTTLGGMPFTLAIMGISFRPSCNNMNVLLPLNVPDLGGSLALAGSGLQIDPNKLFSAAGDAVLYLPQNLTLTAGGLQFNFDGCPNAGSNSIDTSKGVYVNWDPTNGLSKIVVNADISFIGGASIVAVDKNDQRLTTPAAIHAKFSFSDWNDWVASATLPNDFELAGLPGFPIHSDGLFYDHSNHQNPTGPGIPGGIVFPPGYKGAEDASFQGLYIPNLTMSLPSTFVKFNGSTTGGISFQDFILDNSGVTTTINATNILDISTGDLGGWAFSIDKISIGIVQNNFQSGMEMNGQLRLPIASSSLLYTCNLNSTDGKVNYQFVVQPGGQLDIPLWVAQLSLDPNSSLMINNDANGMAIKSHLNGSIGVSIDVSGFPKVNLPALSFQDMAMANRADTNANAATGFFFNAGTWSLGGGVPIPASLTGAFPAGINSSDLAANGPNPGDPTPANAGDPTPADANAGDPTAAYPNAGDPTPADATSAYPAAPAPYDDGSSQSTMAGFSLDLSDFRPYFSPNSTTSFEAGVYFAVKVGIGFGDASVISGSATLGILGQVNFPSGSAPKPSFDKIDCKQVIIDGDIGPVTVHGELDFLNNDATYGDGIKGTLSATFPFAQLNAAAQFGTTLPTAGGFHYWAVGGSVYMDAGILIGPGLTVNGFGGGIYHNMTLSIPNDNDIRSHPPTTPGTFPMVPQNNTTGIQAELLVAIIQPTIVNASLTLSVEIVNGGLGKMQLNGQGYAITDPPENTDAVVSVTMQMTYDFVNKIFDTYIDAQFHFLIAYANAPIWIHGGPDGDYFYVGRPDQGDVNKVSLQLINIGSPGDDLYVNLGATAYFDAGTELPAFPPLPPDIASNLNKSSNDAAVASMLKLIAGGGNPGFMFGADVQGHIRLELLFLYAEVDAELGFDVAFEHVTNPPAGCAQPDGTFGLNNWYGMGQFYAYFDLQIGLHVDAWFYDGDVALVEEKAWAVLQAGLPNPSWVNGEVHVEGSALGGLVHVSGDFPFSFGTECNIPFNPLDDIQMITDIGPTDSADVFASPYAAFSVPMNDVDYPIQVPADQNHSQPYTRTFRFYENQFSLFKEQQDGSDSLVTSIGYGGTVSNSTDGLASSMYPHDMLEPHTRYKVYVKCGVDEVVNGQSQQPAGSPGFQDTTYYFTTGSAPPNLVPENISYSYPIDGQRYLLQNEFGRHGEIRMGYWQYNLLPPPAPAASLGGYNYFVYFLSATGDTLKTTFTMDQANNKLNYTIPAGLKNNMVYDMQVWVVPRTLLAMKTNLPSVTRETETITNKVTSAPPMSNVQPSAASGGSPQPAPMPLMSTVSISRNKIVPLNIGHPLGTIPIFTARFQTSQYNSFADKMAAYGQWTTKTEDNFRDLTLYSTVTTSEEFDEFEMKGYTSGCTHCDADTVAVFPAMFGAAIPWNNSAQNDKFASDNLYANAFTLAFYGITADLGAPEVRDALHPVYTLYTDGMPYQPKLPSLFTPLRSTMTSVANTGYAATNGPKPASANGASSNGGGGNSEFATSVRGPLLASELQPAAPAGMMGFHTAGSFIGLPASYITPSTTSGGSSQSQRTVFTGTLQANTAANNILVVGPHLLWKHDNYIYADYQLLQQFATNFLANQQQTTWLPFTGTIPTALLQALTYGDNVTLATGEYGSVTADPTRYSSRWNDPTITQLANTIRALPFQPLPSGTTRTLQFNYQFPFCGGCSMSSTVPASFNYGLIHPTLVNQSMKLVK